MKFKSDIEVQAGIRDSSGAIGTSGQVLSSTGSNVSWINQTTVASDVQNLVKAGVAINKGQAVYVTGADGTNIIVGLASNTSEATSSKTLGLLNATVAINGMADVVQIGRLSGLNTIGATAGDPVWLGTNGNLIYGLLNKPYAPAHLVFIGIVTRVNANNGEIFINVQNGFELNEIHDVDLKTNVPINGDVLGYDGTLWVNKTIAEWLGYTPANANGTTNYVSKFTGNNSLGNSSIFDNGSAVGIFTSAPNFVTPGRGVLSLNGSSNSLMEFQAGGAFKSYLYQSGTTFEIYDNNAIVFALSGSERMRITSSGNVGIGTSSPNTKLTIEGTLSTKPLGVNAYYSYLRSNWSADNAFELGISDDGVSNFHKLITSSNYYNGSTLQFWTNDSERARFDISGNFGIGTTSPGYRLDINGALRTSSGILNTDSCFEKILATPYFTNGVSDLAVNINLGNISFWGYIEVEVTGAYSNQNTAGKLTKLFAVGTNPGNLIYANESRVSDAFGPVADNMAIGNLYWDGSQYAIQLSHIVSSGNDYTVRIKMFTHLAGAKNVFDAISIGSVYSATALPKQYPYYNDRLGIGTASPTKRLDVVSSTNDSFDAIVVRPNNQTQTLNIGWQGIATSLNFIVSTNGSEKMRVDTTGNVGIGTTSPGYKLDVAGNGRFSSDLLTTGRFGAGSTNVNSRVFASAFSGELAAAIFTTFNSAQSTQEAARFSTSDLLTGAVRIYPRVGAFNYNIITVADSAAIINQPTKPLLVGVQDGSAIQFTETDIRIGTNNSEKMRITSGGNVGIGTSSPNFSSSGRTVLDINGTSNTMLCLSVGGTAGSYLYQAGGNLNISNEVSGNIISFTGGSERMRITSTGIVQVSSGDIFGGNLASDYGSLTLRGGYGATTGSASKVEIRGYEGGGGTQGAIISYTNGTERMRIMQSGNVGIGTSSPSGLLHLSGNSGSPILNIIENNGAVVDSSGTKLQFRFNGVETGFLYNFFDGGDFSTRLSSNGYLAFQAGGVEKMRITSSGNVGIGTTSPNPSALLHLKSTTQGFLPPVMKTGERDNIGSPAVGLMIFNKDDEVIQVYTGDGWRTLAWA